MSDWQAISKQIWRVASSPAYALLDGARNESIYPLLKGSGENYQCLYEGELIPELAEAAPYLVKLERGSALAQKLIEQGWGDSWGIFFQSRASFKEIRRNFRRFLRVTGPNKKAHYFRYYDPRVFRVFLPTCNYDELEMVFGPVNRYCLESENPNTLVEFYLKDSRLEWKYIRLD